eukprot:TRINITY_DN20089_c0_g1_i2.p1 TRINITY_DN20089_c0_g1~~TRINITY_DN20089_c0_g1_i2.p1  ORF type:complete len:178 (-),score=34.49 TRINITY_DN20089_c0_g1_i2:10-543(-)
MKVVKVLFDKAREGETKEIQQQIEQTFECWFHIEETPEAVLERFDVSEVQHLTLFLLFLEYFWGNRFLEYDIDCLTKNIRRFFKKAYAKKIKERVYRLCPGIEEYYNQLVVLIKGRQLEPNEGQPKILRDVWSGDRIRSYSDSIRCFCNKKCLPCTCLLYTSPSPRDRQKSRMPSSA